MNGWKQVTTGVEFNR